MNLMITLYITYCNDVYPIIEQQRDFNYFGIKWSKLKSIVFIVSATGASNLVT